MREHNRGHGLKAKELRAVFPPPPPTPFSFLRRKQESKWGRRDWTIA